MTGPGADQAREADSRYRAGRPEDAALLLEEALEACLQRQVPIPGWLCGRLAAVYRTLGRHDDEVHVLERYRSTQRTEEARTRFDARLTKALTIADRKRKTTSGALDSVRLVLEKPRGRKRRVETDVSEVASVFSATTVDALNAALAAPESKDPTPLSDAIALMCAEAHANGIPVDALVALLRGAVATAQHDTEDGQSQYGRALLLLLATFYKDE